VRLGLAKLDSTEHPKNMPRPLTRAQALQNQAFLAELRRTGNVREAARTLGIHRATLTKRRAKHLAFAAEWDAALALAHARLNGGEGSRTTATEPRVTRTASGRLQLRRPQRGRLTRAAEQAFLAALSATANVRLAAAAAGFSHSAFYHRRKTHPGFAREMRLALQLGYDRLELALLSSTLPEAHVDDACATTIRPRSRR
jgi:transcriptional regulator of acetoin/glycerol metabolism